MDEITIESERGKVRRGWRRAAGAAVVVALVAGPLVGYRLGQRLGERERVGVASEQGEVPEAARDDPPAAGDAELVAPTPTDEAGTGGGFAPQRHAALDVGYGYGYGYDLEPAGVVDVDDATVRLFRSTYPLPDYGNPLWDPPVGCFPTGSVIAQVSTAQMVATVHAELFGLRTTEGVTQLVGTAEGDPRWVAVGATDAEAVTIRFADGRSVDAPVVAGVFTAVSPADDANPAGEPTATAVANGQEFPLGSWAGPTDENFHQQCQPPPPALPPAGAQPSDPDAARDEIAAAYELAYGGGQDQLGAFADRDAMASVLEDLDASEAFDAYRGQITAVVGEIVFDSPTHAWLFYDLDPVLTQRIGEAVHTERGWKIANETMCADVSLVGVRCD